MNQTVYSLRAAALRAISGRSWSRPPDDLYNRPRDQILDPRNVADHTGIDDVIPVQFRDQPWRIAGTVHTLAQEHPYHDGGAMNQAPQPQTGKVALPATRCRYCRRPHDL